MTVPKLVFLVFSIPFLIKTALAAEPLRIGETKNSDVGKFPSNWKCIEKRSDIYTVEIEDGNSFISARADQSAGFIITKVKLDPREHPILRWRWRARRLPVGGDETGKHGRNDCGASVYVIFNRGVTKYNKHTLRYVWSSFPHPKGKTLKKRNVYYVIQENRESPLDVWVEEEVNYLEDYKRLFRKNPPKKILAIGIQSDSDDTRTHSWADYDDLFLIPSEEKR